MGWTDGRVRGRSKRGAAKVCPARAGSLFGRCVPTSERRSRSFHFGKWDARSLAPSDCLSVCLVEVLSTEPRQGPRLSFPFFLCRIKSFGLIQFPTVMKGGIIEMLQQNSRVCTVGRGTASSKTTSAEEIRPNITITLRGDFSLLSHKVELGGGGKAWHGRASSSF